MAGSYFANGFPLIDPFSEIICRLANLLKKRMVTEFPIKVLPGKLSEDAIRVKSTRVNLHY